MTITVSAGVDATGLTISSGDPLVVLSSGYVQFSTILSGGSATLSSGALGSFLTVDSGGTLVGSAYLEGDNDVFGSIGGLTLGAGYLTLFSGGTANEVTIAGGGSPESIFQVDSGAFADGVIVESGGTEIIYAGGSAGGGATESGGTLYLDGGTTAEVTVFSGGTLALGGDLTSDLTVSSGAVQSVGLVAGVAVSSGGFVDVIGATVESGMTLTLLSGAVASGLTVVKGGAATGTGSATALIEIAGSIGGLSVVGSGDLTLTSGAIASGVTIVSGGIKVDAGASATGTTVSSGGLARIYSGGVTVGDILSSGGKEIVSSGGVGSGTQVLGGGLEYVLASGATNAMVVSSGGKELLSSGGVANATNVSSGGAAYVYSGSLDKRAVVSSGGAEEILSGGTASDLSLLAGGRLTDDGRLQVAGAGTLAGDLAGSGAVIETGGGDLLLKDGGAGFTGNAVIEGGTIELGKSGALGAGVVVFDAPSTGSSVLQIDAAAAPAPGKAFTNIISNFNADNEDIDLTSIAFVAGASADIQGSTLVLYEGGETYAFGIDGTEAGEYPVLSDGHGGTLIDPKAINPKVLAFTHTVAAFAPADAAHAALASSTSPNGQTPFLHATASVSAGHP